jgi:hypothetical protein
MYRRGAMGRVGNGGNFPLLKESKIKKVSNYNRHEYDFYTLECDFYTQSVEFILAECNFNTCECDFNTHKIDFYTQSKISTRRM